VELPGLPLRHYAATRRCGCLWRRLALLCLAPPPLLRLAPPARGAQDASPDTPRCAHNDTHQFSDSFNLPSAGIYAKTVYGTSLANVDWLHGSSESLLTVTNLLLGALINIDCR
jgi:Protein of unknown function (DUF3593)